MALHSALFLATTLYLMPAPVPRNLIIVDGRVLEDIPSFAQPLPGVTVTIYDEERRTTKSIVTEADGFYYIQLPPGTYTITYSLEGFRAERLENVKVYVSPVTKDVKLRQGIGETITVTAYAPLVIDTRQTIQLQPLPTLPRTITSALQWLGTIGLNLSGPDVLILPEINIDGVAGLRATDVAGNVQILRGALPAEYSGGGSGTALLLDTPVTGDKLEVRVDGDLQPGSLRASSEEVGAPFAHEERSAQRRLNAFVGSRLIPDQLWVFGSYGTDKKRVTQSSANGETAGDAEIDRRVAELKLTLSPFEDLSVENHALYASSDDSGVIGDFHGHLNGTLDVTTNERTNRFLQDRLSATFAVADNVSISAGVNAGQRRESFEPRNLVPAPQLRDGARGFFSSSGSGFVLDDASTQTIAGNVKTIWILKRHELAAGGTWERNRDHLRTAVTGGEVIDLYDDASVAHFLTRIGFAAGRDDHMHSMTRDLFLQDRIKIAERLTANLGVRRQSFDGNGATVRFSTAAILPRIGMSLDVFNNGRTQLAASYSAYARDFTTDDQRGLLGSYGINGLGPALFGDASLRPQTTKERIVSYSQNLPRWMSLSFLASDRRTTDDVVLAQCTESIACLGNPGRGVLAAAPRLVREERRAEARYSWYAPNAPLTVSYIWSRTRGNLEPRAFPATEFTVDPYVDLRHAFASFYSGTEGPLHSDRRHRATLAGELRRSWATIEYSAYWMSGSPISRFGYSDRAGTYTNVLGKRGDAGRTPSVYEASIVAERDLHVSTEANVRLRVGVANVLNRQGAMFVDERWSFRERDNSAPLPTNPAFGQPIIRTPPRTITFGLHVLLRELQF